MAVFLFGNTALGLEKIALISLVIVYASSMIGSIRSHSIVSSTILEKEKKLIVVIIILMIVI